MPDGPLNFASRVPPGGRLLGVLAVAAALLAPSLGGTWIWDEYRLILESPAVQDLGSIPSFFGANLAQGAGGTGVAASGVDVFRPLYLSWFALLWALAPGSAFVFHLGSMAWHLLTVSLVWTLGRRISRRPGLAEAAALLVALHPVTSEAWAVIGSVCDPMASALLLAAGLVLTAPRVSARRALAGGALVTAAVFSKETALMALPVGAWLLWRRGLRAQLVPAVLGALSYLGLRTAALGGLSGTGGSTEQRIEALHHLPILLVDGIRGVVAMRPLGVRHLSWEYRDLSWGLSVGAAVLLVAVAALVWRARRRRPVLAAALAVSACMLAPVALVSTIDGWGGFGRFLYLPSAVLALAFVEAAEATGRGRWAGLGVLFALQLMALPTVLHDWSSPEALARSGIRQAPDAGIHWVWLGEALQREGRLAEALPAFEQGHTLTPSFEMGWTNHADALRSAGRCPEARAVIEQKNAQLGAGPKGELLVALCFIDEGRFDDASDRLLGALAAGGGPQLQRLAVELVKVHPGRWDYRDRLRAQLADGHAAAPLLLPVLDAGARLDPRPTEPTDPASSSPD